MKKLGAGREDFSEQSPSYGQHRSTKRLVWIAISCFVYADAIRRAERAEGGPCGVKETPDQLCSPPPSMLLPGGSSPGTENYLCLQIAFASRELFLWPANRSGDENYPA